MLRRLLLILAAITIVWTLPGDLRSVVTLLAQTACTDATPVPATCLSIQKRDITWTFSTGVAAGRFASGDWWVTGPVTIADITPKDTNGDATAMHGTMINPPVSTGGMTQGWDSRMTQHSSGGLGYSGTVNVADGPYPFAVPVNSSLLSARSFVDATERNQYVCSTCTANSHFPWVRSIEVLTVLSGTASATDFRPPYVGTNKSIDAQWDTSSIDYSKLNTLKRLPSTPAIGTMQSYAVEPQIEVVLGWKGRYAHPAQNYIPARFPGSSNGNYGQAIANSYGAMLLAVNLDFTVAEKQPIVYRLIQIGIDIYGAATNVTPPADGVLWRDGGGHNQGRKMPLLFAGWMLGDQPLIDRANNALYQIFQEDSQHFRIASADDARTHGPPINGQGCATITEYNASDVGRPEWGVDHITSPANDNNKFNTCYRDQAGSSTLPSVLAAKWMGVQALWNHPVLFDYYNDIWADTEISTGLVGATNHMEPYVADLWTAYKNAPPPSGTPPPMDAPPVISITSPTSATTYNVTNATTSLTVGGTASDDNTLPAGSVTWVNSATGGSGTATGTGTWSIAGALLNVGVNLFTVVVTDSAKQQTTDQLSVTRAASALGPIDDFERADGLSLGSNWVCPTTLQMAIADSGKASATGNTGRHFCWWTATLVAGNRSSTCTVGNTPTVTKITACGVRFSGTTDTTYNGYVCNAEGAGLVVAAKYVNATRTELGRWTLPGGATWAPNDTLTAQAVGNLLTCLRQGTAVGNVATGGEFTNGQPMIGGFAVGTVEAWVAGSVTGSDVVLPIVSILVPAVDSFVTASNTLTSLTWTASDANGVATCTCTNSSGQACVVTGTVSGSGTNLPLAPGSQTFRIACLDPSGNEGADTVDVFSQPVDPPPSPEDVTYNRRPRGLGKRR